MIYRLSALWLALLPFAVGCGLPPGPSATTPPGTSSGTSTATLHADVTDPAGDVLKDSRVPVPPDLIRATADISDMNVTFSIQFAPGTLDRRSTRVSVLLDTDLYASSGIRVSDGIGADYGLDLDTSRSLATVTRADPSGCAAQHSCFIPVGATASIAFTTDRMQVTVPLSSLGSSDGRMAFEMHAYVLVDPTTPVVFDLMPDASQPPGRIQ